MVSIVCGSLIVAFIVASIIFWIKGKDDIDFRIGKTLEEKHSLWKKKKNGG